MNIIWLWWAIIRIEYGLMAWQLLVTIIVNKDAEHAQLAVINVNDTNQHSMTPFKHLFNWNRHPIKHVKAFFSAIKHQSNTNLLCKKPSATKLQRTRKCVKHHSTRIRHLQGFLRLLTKCFTSPCLFDSRSKRMRPEKHKTSIKTLCTFLNWN